MLGGGVPNVAFQLGVCEALKDWGFSIPTGCRSEDEDREYGNLTLNPIIGSSSGAFAAISTAMGLGYDELLCDGGEVNPITEDIIRDRIETNPLSFLKRLYTSRKKYTRLKNLVHSTPSIYEHLINTYYPIWKMDALKEYIREQLLDGCDFESLRAELQIMAVTQEQRMTLIIGEESHPRDPYEDFKFQNGIPLWEAAAGSMSLPPYYEPYEFTDPPEEIAPADGESIILIDGETRDPFTTDAAQESDADLIIVSSFYRVHEYTPGLGHLSDYGILPVMWQERAQGKDARKFDSIQNRKQKQKALELYREQLQESCVTQEEIEENMREMEEVLKFQENLDVVEIQAQEYREKELTYPYWDPFGLQTEVVEYQYEAGQAVANEALQNQLV